MSESLPDYDGKIARPPAPSPGAVTGEREAMLAKMRAALATPTSPHLHSTANRGGPGHPHPNLLPEGEGTRGAIAGVLPPVPATWEQQAALFGLRSERLRTAFFLVDDAAEAQRMVARVIAAEAGKASGQAIDEDDDAAIAASAGAVGVAYHDHAVVQSAMQLLRDGPRVKIEPSYDRAAFERCGVGITTCEALVAQTGSVLVSSAQCGGRTLSVLPPHHIVLATADQLVSDLPAAYARVRARLTDGGTSMTSLITGPSRTGDIERILVLGAHGPRELTVILMRT